MSDITKNDGEGDVIRDYIGRGDIDRVDVEGGW